MEIYPQENVTLARWPEDVRQSLQEFQAALRQIYGRKAPRLLVYGSYARGQANPASDIDILLIYSSPVLPGSEIHRLSPILAALNTRYQVLITVLPVNQADWLTDQSAFVRTVRREAVPIG